MRTEHSNRRHSSRRFSIIETAVVAVIVLLLIASIFPVRAMARFQKEKQIAYDRSRSIEFALRGYFEEYKNFPIDPTSFKDDFYETTSNEALMAILRGGKHPQNQLGTRFYIPPDKSDPEGAVLDPWGNLYHVRIDSDSDKHVPLPPECAGDVKKVNEGRIKTQVIVWSKGRESDGKFEGEKAWIKSWDRP